MTADQDPERTPRPGSDSTRSYRTVPPGVLFGLGLVSALVFLGLVGALLLALFGRGGGDEPSADPTTTTAPPTATTTISTTAATTTTSVPPSTTTTTVVTAGLAGVPALHASIVETFPQAAFPDELLEDGKDVRELWHDPDRGVRLEVEEATGPGAAADAAGSFMVWVGGEADRYQVATNIYDTVTEDVPPYLGVLALTPAHSEGTCSQIGRATQLGRATVHFECLAGASSWEMWVDQATGLMLRQVWDYGYVFEVASLEINPEFPAGTFEFVPPPGAQTPEEWLADPWNHMTLVEGEEAPTWEAPRVGASDLKLERLRGEPALIFFWDATDEDDSLPAAAVFQELYDAWRRDVNFVSVALREKPDEVRLLMSENGLTFPTVDCFGGRCSPTSPDSLWGLDTIPFWVLLDSAGRAAGAQLPTADAASQLEAALEAITS